MSDKHKAPAIYFILITLVLDMLGIGLVVPVLPGLVTSFRGGDVSSASGYFGVFVAVYAVMQLVFSPVLGGLSDTFGRRPVILVSLVGAGLDYLFMAMAPSLGWLFVGRVISGITGANVTAANAYVADVSPPEKRAQNFGLLGACFGVGFVLGPAIGGVLGGVSPRLPFFVAAALNLGNALYGLLVLPESNPPENRRPFAWKGLNPVSSLGVLARYPAVLRLTATFACAGLAQQCLQSTWVLYTTYRFHWTTMQTGLSLSVVGVMAAVVQGGLTRVIIPRLGEQRALLYAQYVGVVAFTLYGSLTHGWMLYFALMFGSLGGIAIPAAQALVSRAVSSTEQGAVQGALAALQSLTAIIGPLVSTSLLGWFTGKSAPAQVPGAAFFLGAILIFIGALFAMRAFRDLPASTVDAVADAATAP